MKSHVLNLFIHQRRGLILAGTALTLAAWWPPYVCAQTASMVMASTTSTEQSGLFAH